MLSFCLYFKFVTFLEATFISVKTISFRVLKYEYIVINFIFLSSFSWSVTVFRKLTSKKRKASTLMAELKAYPHLHKLMRY